MNDLQNKKKSISKISNHQSVRFDEEGFPAKKIARSDP
jgi:hypothetical protein